MSGETVTSAEVIATTGVTVRQLGFWATKGYVRPEHTGGSGHGRRWPPVEVAVVRVMVRLVAVGMLPHAAARMALHVRAGEPEVPTGYLRLYTAEHVQIRVKVDP